MNDQNQTALVSVHGGHSSEFCHHASDPLKEIIEAYIEKGFAWVGITEHMPPLSDRFLYPDEKAAGLDAQKIYRQFVRYFAKCRELQQKYRSQIEIYVGFETETYSGSTAFIRKLIQRFHPDYIVGSVHHVNDCGFDHAQEQYQALAHTLGGMDALYCRYFDLQYEMLTALKPAVIGHFDLIRIFDPAYRTRLQKPAIQERIYRNLKCIKTFDGILDFNTRALYKGADEPYVSRSILERAIELDIAVTPGDDSHSLDTVGFRVKKATGILQALRADTTWRKPGSGFPAA